MAKRVMPNSAAPVAIATSRSTAMTARVAIAVRPASLIATPSGSVGEHERALQRARRRQAAPLGHGAAADEAWIDAVEPQKEGNDRQRRAHEYDQRLRVAVDAPRFRR